MIKNILELSPKIKTFWNVLHSYTVFHSGMFFKVLQYSIRKHSKFEKVPDYPFPSRLLHLLKYTKIEFKAYGTSSKAKIAFKKEYIKYVINHPTLHYPS